MRRIRAVLGTAVFMMLAPVFVAGVVPWAIEGWVFQPAPLWLRVPGAFLIGLGLIPLLDCFARFALEGLGTPAPIAPTQRLVVSGPYRHVRNPMYVAVVLILLGQAALFGDLRLLGYAAFVWLAFHVFVLVYEEPVLRRSHPDDYPPFFAAVPRWIPRLTPWEG